MINQKKTYQIEDEINLSDLIKYFWRHKVLVLFFSILFMLLGLLYGFYQSKKKDLQTSIILQIPSAVVLNKYKDFLGDDSFINNNNKSYNNTNTNTNTSTDTFALFFLNNLKTKLSSKDNLESFLEQSKQFDNFKVFLKERNITTRQYFTKERFGIKTNAKQQLSDEFFLHFNKELDGVTFLNNYVEFTKNKIINDIRNTLKIKLLIVIERHDNAFEIANQIKLEVPILKSMSSGSSVVYEPSSLFYLGTEVLSQQSKYFRKLLLDLETDKLDFEVILDKASPAMAIENNLFGVWTGLVFGFFFSLVIIFFKFLLKKNN